MGFLSPGTKQTVHNTEVSILRWVAIKEGLTTLPVLINN